MPCEDGILVEHLVRDRDRDRDRVRDRARDRASQATTERPHRCQQPRRRRHPPIAWAIEPFSVEVEPLVLHFREEGQRYLVSG